MHDNDDDEKYRELFYLFRSCWAIYKFILCDTIGKIYTVCLIKCIRIEKICCETEERYLAKRERLFFEIVIVSPILTFFSLSYFTWKELDTDINVGRFERNRMKITYDNIIIDKRDKNHSFNE